MKLIRFRHARGWYGFHFQSATEMETDDIAVWCWDNLEQDGSWWMFSPLQRSAYGQLRRMVTGVLGGHLIVIIKTIEDVTMMNIKWASVERAPYQ